MELKKKLILILASIACAYSYSVDPDLENSKDFSEVTITESVADDASDFVNHLLGILVKKSILNEATANRLLATFDIEGAGQFKKGEAFTTKNIKYISVKGDADARKKFAHNLAESVKKSDKSGDQLIKYLLELILDNRVLDINEAAQLAGDNGYGASIKVTRYYESAWQAESFVTYDSTVTITNTPSPDNIQKFINVLLELLIKHEIINKNTAADILATFGVKGSGSLADVPGKVLTDVTISKITINRDPDAAEKFIKLITLLLKNKKNTTSLIIYLLQLLIDNGAIDIITAKNLAASYNITVTIIATTAGDETPAPPPTKPPTAAPAGPTTKPPPPKCPQLTIQEFGMQWSFAGPVAGKHCVQILEPADPHTWADNYLCFAKDFGAKWSFAGPIANMDCTQILEPADPHTWADNYLCFPKTTSWRFRWSYAGPIGGLSCVQMLEPADPHTWADNYLCVDRRNPDDCSAPQPLSLCPKLETKEFGMQWSFAGPVANKHCIQILEPADPHTWADNYLCFDRDYGIKWSYAGPIPEMECTQILEPADPHTWADNYLCYPKSTSWRLRWSFAGPVNELSCTQINEPADPHTWADNFLCVERRNPSDCSSPQPPRTCPKLPVEQFGMQWAFAGPIPGKHCVQISEPADPHTWADNYLCFDKDYGVKWSFAGPIANMDCTMITEPADPHTWADNFLCVPKDSQWRFRWSYAGTINYLSCLWINEPADPHTWTDNFLCIERRNANDCDAPKTREVCPRIPTSQFGMQWSFAGPVAGKHCVQILEPADPHTWADNYLCFDKNYGVKWSYAGPIADMDCTWILEPADPHTWNDNYLCVPKGGNWRFRWSYAGITNELGCVQMLEPADPHTWADNYVCIERNDPYDCSLSAPPKICDKLPIQHFGMQWSFAGPVKGKHCIQILEPADPHTWADNYLCFDKDYGVKWYYAGAIPGMDCTQINEPADPHTWADNFLCVPNTSPWRFRWSFAGPINDLSCVQMLEPADPHTWADNYLCVERRNKNDCALPPPPPQCPKLPVEQFGMQWWYAGPIAGKHCVQISEPADPHTWADNYLCFDKDYGVKWSFAGPIANMDCTMIVEPADKHTWNDNFLCVPKDNQWRFRWSYAGPIPGLSCLWTSEPADPDTWQDNFLCIERRNANDCDAPKTREVCPRIQPNQFGMQWSFAGPVAGKHCVQILEPADPHTWADNYLCFDKDYDVKWSYAGPIANMDCTWILEPADPHTWNDNYLCVPKDSSWRFRWTYAGVTNELGCVQMLEPADPHTWADNYVCLERKDPYDCSPVRSGAVCPQLPIQHFGMQWSFAGPVGGKQCIQIIEPADPHTWGDNYLCFDRDYGAKWYYAGAIPNMDCTQISEPADPHTWADNYLCLPKGRSWGFRWSFAGPINGLSCLQINEPADPHTWADNYLCVERKDKNDCSMPPPPKSCPQLQASQFGMQWSFAGPVGGKHCVQALEPADPHTWADNYLCFDKDYGVKWAYAGAIGGMDCTMIVEPADPHTWNDNFFCVPPTSPWRFRWSYAGPIPGLSCVQMLEPADPHTWADNYICVERRDSSAC